MHATVVVAVVVVLTLIGILKVRGHRTGSSHSEVEEYPGEKTQANQKKGRMLFV